MKTLHRILIAAVLVSLLVLGAIPCVTAQSNGIDNWSISPAGVSTTYFYNPLKVPDMANATPVGFNSSWSGNYIGPSSLSTTLAFDVWDINGNDVGGSNYGINEVGGVLTPFNTAGGKSPCSVSGTAWTCYAFYNVTSNNPYITAIDSHTNTVYVYNESLLGGINSAVTITVKDKQTNFPIPRASVTIQSNSTGGIPVSTSGITGSVGSQFGNVTLTVNLANEPQWINATKAGYNSSSVQQTFAPSPIQAYTIYLNESSTIGGNATVFLDVYDITTGNPITGATVGIENMTATVNPWTYATYATSTIPFNSTDIPPIKLSVGQSVQFSGYVTGTYVANNTGVVTLTGTNNYASLGLSPVSGNTSAYYYWPVTITDATTGNPIGTSNLSSANLNTCSPTLTGCTFWNQTSASGKFNVTGEGTLGTTPIQLGDSLLLIGNAPGYVQNGFSILMTANNNGVTQFIPLTPSSINPIAGQFTAIVNVYSTGTNAAISGATVTLNGNNSKLSSNTGSVTFTNLTAGNSYSMTVTANGYSPQSQIFTGGSQAIVTIQVGLSPSSVNPTATVTPTGTVVGVVTPAANGTYVGLWGNAESVLAALGAQPNEIGIGMAAILILVGLVLGATAGGPLGAAIGAFVGVIFSVIFGFISFLWILVIIFVGFLIAIFFRQG